MDINEILDLVNNPSESSIAQLKKKSVNVPAWSDLVKQYDPTKHPVMDTTYYPDITESDGTTTKVTRIPLNFQKLAVKRLNELCFGVPVKRVYDIDEADLESQAVAEVMENIFKNNRIDSVNINRGRRYFAACEVMTLWYAVEDPNTYYGIESPLKLRCVSFSPMEGDELYPLMDEYGDMIALSVQYVRKEGDSNVTYFDTYTKDRHIKWRNSDGWKIVEDDKIVIGKIPAIYMHRDAPAWEDTNSLVEEMEWSLSRNGNYLRENSKPLFVVYADEEIPFGREDRPEKEFKSILKYPRGSNAQYVTWQQSVESLKFHILELKQEFFTQLQLPDWSFDNMKSVPQSGESMKQMYIDAVLKVREESGAIIEFCDREVNVVKAFLKQIRPAWAERIDSLRVDVVVTPCTLDESFQNTEEMSGQQDGTMNVQA